MTPQELFFEDMRVEIIEFILTHENERRKFCFMSYYGMYKPKKKARETGEVLDITGSRVIQQKENLRRKIDGFVKKRFSFSLYSLGSDNWAKSLTRQKDFSECMKSAEVNGYRHVLWNDFNWN